MWAEIPRCRDCPGNSVHGGRGVSLPRFSISTAAECGERHLEDHTQFQGGLTRRFARRLVADATVMSIRAASRHHGVGWHRIMRLVSAEAAGMAERRRARPCRVLLVDETSIHRRHRYVTVVACGDSGKVPGDDLRPHERVSGPLLPRSGSLVVPPGGDRRFRRHPAHIRLPSPSICPMLAMCWIGLMWLAGSPKVSPSCAERYDAVPLISVPRHMGRTCSEPCFTLLRRADHLTDAHQAHLDGLFDAHPRLRTAWGALFKSSTSSMKPTT